MMSRELLTRRRDVLRANPVDRDQMVDRILNVQSRPRQPQSKSRSRSRSRSKSKSKSKSKSRSKTELQLQSQTQTQTQPPFQPQTPPQLASSEPAIGEQLFGRQMPLPRVVSTSGLREKIARLTSDGTAFEHSSVRLVLDIDNALISSILPPASIYDAELDMYVFEIPQGTVVFRAIPENMCHEEDRAFAWFSSLRWASMYGFLEQIGASQRNVGEKDKVVAYKLSNDLRLVDVTKSANFGPLHARLTQPARVVDAFDSIKRSFLRGGGVNRVGDIVSDRKAAGHMCAAGLDGWAHPSLDRIPEELLVCGLNHAIGAAIAEFHLFSFDLAHIYVIVPTGAYVTLPVFRPPFGAHAAETSFNVANPFIQTFLDVHPEFRDRLPQTRLHARTC